MCVDPPSSTRPAEFVPSADPVAHGMLAEVVTVHVKLVTPSTIVVVLSIVAAIASYLFTKSIVPAPPNQEPANLAEVT